MSNLSLTPCEAEVMTIVWARKSATVQDVVDAMPRQLAYTTVMTTFRILQDKGFVERTGKRGRAIVYSPIVSQDSVLKNSLKETSHRFFGGSFKSMVLSLIKTNQISAEDLAELRSVIDSIEK